MREMNLYILKSTDEEERHISTGSGDYDYETINVPTFDFYLFLHSEKYTEKEWNEMIESVKYAAPDRKKLKTPYLIIEELEKLGFQKIPFATI
jgi:hypothetical protein